MKKKVYSNSETHKLLEATYDLRLIWKISKNILKSLYLKPFAYNKVGIILSDLTRKKEIQQSLIESKLQNKIKKMKLKSCK